MAIAAGMTSAITNPLESQVRSTVMAADVLAGHDESCARWIAANRNPNGSEPGRRRSGRRRTPSQ